MSESFAENEAELEQLIQQGEIQEAVKILTHMALACAHRRDFNRADAYRDRLYEVDGMALTAIIKVNEAIEAEKSKYLEADRGSLWQRFFKELPTAEANAFFFALTETEMAADQILLSQGLSNNRLYLINQGQLKEYYDGTDKQVMIRQLGSGHIVGEDTFFSVNVCTLSVATLTRVRLSCLTQDRLDILTRQFSDFSLHLQNICCPGNSTFDLLRRKGIDRRIHKRIHYQAKLWFQLLTPDQHNSMQKPIAGVMWDISKTGLSFYFQYKNRQAVRRLLGKTMGLRFNLSVGGVLKEISLTGVVQGVQNHPLDEYSVHIKLNRSFSNEAIQTIRRIAAGQ